jgi:hypothetical protein
MGLGQFTGSKVKVAYTSDNGAVYNMSVDADLITAAQSLPAATAGVGSSKPLGIKLRGVHWKATGAGFEGSVKFLVCGSVDAPLYSSDAPQAVTIDGVTGITTGRRGETLSFR